MPKPKTHIKVTASVDNSIAYINIVDYIGDENANANSTRIIVDDMLAKGVTTAEVYLNSQGGSVFDATEMANQLARFEDVKIRVGAIAASAGTYLTSKFYTIAAKNSQFMIHKPSSGVWGDVAKIQSTLKLLENLTADYKATYVAKTKLKEADIEAMWAKGDYWMTATEALEKGFIDEVTADEALIEEDDLALLTAVAAPLIPQIQKPNTKNTKMERLALIAALGLAADATDELITATIASNRQKAEQYDTAQKAQAKLVKLKAKQLVDAAVVAKKITAEDATSYQTLAESNYEEVEKVLAVKTSTPKLSNEINGGTPQAANVDARKDWSLDDWLEKDPEAFAKLEEEDPEKFKQINNAYFKS